MDSPIRSRTVAAWSTFGVAMLMAGLAGGLWIVNARATSGVLPPQIFVVPGFGLVGAVVTARSRNIIGPLFLALAVVGAGTALTFEYAVRAVGTAPGSLPWGGYAAALSNGGFPFTWLALGLTLLLFPDGHLPSARWRVPAWGFVIVWSLSTVLSLFVPSLDLAAYTIENPIGLGGPTVLADVSRNPLLATVWSVIGFVLLAAMGAAPIVRRRGAGAETRQQLRWFALVLEAILVLAILAVVLAYVHADLAGAVIGLVILFLVALGVPAAIGIAVLKYRLYDLDIVINKTVVYAGLATFITGVYVAIVVGIGTLLGTGDQANVPLSIAATAIVAVAFQPVRERVQRLANRLLYGKRATPYEVLAEFSERLGGAYDSEDLLPRMARILAEGTGAQRSDVWLGVDGQLRSEASWPMQSATPDPLPLEPFPDGLFPVRHQDELLGALSIEKRPGEPVTATERSLVEHLAGQAGLVLRNVRLTEALIERLNDLKASRQRLVAAQDEERRKLERNLHDGAQQQLVALAVKARLAQQLITRDPDGASTMLDAVRSDTNDALQNLRDLARGIYPPLLADKGLAVALRAQAGKVSVPTEIVGDGTARFAQDVEAAVYFSCLEALQNVAKYAGATQVVITLIDADGSLRFTVHDDGCGFDLGATSYGTGLQGMADRLSAMNGDLTVESQPGDGTTVTGIVPFVALAVDGS
jgi:signal transduction histidine kinase